MAGWTLGVIGGSGLYEIEGLEDRRRVRVESPFGEPSDELLTGRIGEVRLVFLPRHGRGHRLPPTHVNARANIDALKRAGCTDVVSLSAVHIRKAETSLACCSTEAGVPSSKVTPPARSGGGMAMKPPCGTWSWPFHAEDTSPGM